MTTSRIILVTVLVLTTAVLSGLPGDARALWPPVAALLVILATRRALLGLLVGGYLGAVLLSEGNPWQAYLAVFRDHLAPSLTSPWKTGAVAFTLVLGGFAAVLEAGGGFTALLRRLASTGGPASRRFELSALALGLLCFFDGLANSMMVGRVGRHLADRCGTTRVKLPYIVDSTSSAVACVALVSTWIAFQLSMIEEGYRLAGHAVNPYAAFLQSLPYNFHCWFTLVLLAAAIWWRFEPGPMGRFTPGADEAGLDADDGSGGRGALAALAPVAVLLVAFMAGFIWLGGGEPRWPVSRQSLVTAFGSDAGPLVMVLAGLVATLAAGVALPGPAHRRGELASRRFADGVRSMLAPVFVLVAAWILGSVVQDLGTARLVASLVEQAGSPALVPLLTFLTGAVVSFATGTSWGTMGLLFPLALPAAAGDPALLPVTVAAVFSGAVFGDHCSPFSDTTIVTSIACEIEPHDHVRTQMPYALLAAVVAALVGFLPAGLGVWPGWSLLLGGGLLVLICRVSGRRART